MTTLACNPTAIADVDRERWIDVSKRVYAAVQEVQDLPDGYAFRLPSSADVLFTLAEHIAFERRCCPFLRFAIEVEPEQGPVWLRVTGDNEGVKEFVRASVDSLLI